MGTIQMFPGMYIHDKLRRVDCIVRKLAMRCYGEGIKPAVGEVEIN